jgi:trigger factor
MMGLDDEGFRLRFRDSAEDKVKGGLLLMALVEKENINASDEDLAARYELIAAGNPDMLGRIKEYYSSNKSGREALLSEIKEDKAIRFLLDNSVVTEVDAATIKDSLDK